MKTSKKNLTTKKNSSKTSLYLLTIILFLGSSVSAQYIEEVYKSMPDKYNPLLTQMQRFELLEYYKANQGDSVINKHGTKSFLLELDTVNHYLKVQNTEISQTALQLIPGKKEYSIMMINTVCGNICRSYLRFFDENWEEKPINFTFPTAKSWLDTDKLSNESQEKQDYISNLLNVDFIEIELIPSENKMIVKNNSLDFLNKEDKKTIEPFLIKEPIVYHFTGKNWIRL